MIRKLLLKTGVVIFAILLIIACYFWINTLNTSDPFIYFFINYFNVLGITVVLILVAFIASKLVKKLY